MSIFIQLVEKMISLNETQTATTPYLCEFPFRLFKVCVVFDIGLNFGVLCYPLQFRRFRDGGGFGFWDVSANKKKQSKDHINYHSRLRQAVGKS